MKSSIVFTAAGVVGVVAASSPQITAAPAAQLLKRQADPALLGYISTEGASSCKFSLIILHTQPPGPPPFNIPVQSNPIQSQTQSLTLAQFPPSKHLH